MPKIISTLVLVLMFVLMVPAGLIMISQDSVKGEWNYPIKRGIEDVVLAGASLNPYTRAYYSVALANRRYDESEKLLALGANADNSLDELVEQTTVAADNIGNLKNSTDRAKLVDNLADSIEKYDQGLVQAQEQIIRRSELQMRPPSSAMSVSSYQSLAPSSTPTSVPAPSVQEVPEVKTTPVPQKSRPVFSLPPGGDEDSKRQFEAIEKTRKELEMLKVKLEIEQEGFTPDAQAPKIQPQSLREEEDVQKRREGSNRGR